MRFSSIKDFILENRYFLRDKTCYNPTPMQTSKAKKLLLVEDEPVTAMTHKRQLESLGYQIRHVNTGEKAVSLITNENHDIDLILMDIDLGKGIDGTQAAQEILQFKNIPILFLSSHTEPEIVERAEKITSYGYVVKNSGLTVLNASIKMAFRLYEAIIREQKKEEALEKSEERYRLIIENANEAIVIFQKEHPVYFNQKTLQLSGYTASEYRNLTMKDIAHPDDLPMLKAKHKIRTEGSGGNETYSIRIITKSGETRWLRMNATPIVWEGKYASLGLLEDITESVLTRQELLESQAKLSEALQIAQMGSWELDLNTLSITLSPEHQIMLGEKREKVSMPLEEYAKKYMHAEDIVIIEEHLASALENQNNINYRDKFEYRLQKTRDNFPIYLAVRGRFRKKNIIHGITQDISREKKLFLELQKSENIFRTAFHTAPDSVNINAMDGRYVDINEGFTRLTGYTRDDVIGLLSSEIKIWDIPEDREKLVQGLTKNGYVDNLESRFRCKDGKLKTGIMSAKIIQLNNEPHILSITRDITDRKVMEKELRNSEENLRITLNSIGDAVISTDTAGKIVQMNRIAENLTGWQRKEAIGRTLNEVFQIVNAKSRKKVSNPVQRVLEHGNIIGLANDTLLLSKNGQEYQIADSAAPVKDRQGNVVGTVMVFRDVTQEYAVNQALKLHQKRLEQAQKVAKLGHYAFDAITGLLTYSKGLDAIMGIDENFPKDVEGWLQLVHPEDRADMGRYLSEDVLTRHEKFDKVYRIITFRDKEEKWVHGTGTLKFDQDGNVLEMFGTIQDISERMRYEEELRRSEATFRDIFENSLSGIFIMTIEGKVIEANPYVYHLYGYDEGDMIGLHGRDLLDPSNYYLFEDFVQALQEGRSYTTESLDRRKDGSTFHVEVRGKPFLYKNKPHFLALVNDITERKVAEQKLKESEERFRNAIDGTMDGLWDLNPETNEAYISDRYSTMLGYEPGELPNSGEAWSELLHPEDKEKALQNLKDYLEGKMETYTGIFRMRTKDGSYRWIQSRGKAIRDQFGKALRVIGFTTDITERIEADKKIREQAQMINSVGQAIISTDLEGKINFFNKAAEDLYGWKTKDVMGKNIIDITPSSKSKVHAEEIMSSLRKGMSWRGEFPVRKKDGSEFLAHVFDSPIYDQNGGLIGIIGISYDITEQRQAEIDLHTFESKLKGLFEIAPVGIVVIKNRTFQQGNIFFSKMTGYAPDEFLGKKTRFLFFNDEEHEIFGHELYSQLLSRKIATVETRFRHKSGREILVIVKASLPEKSDPYEEHISTILDVTDRKKAEREIHKQLKDKEILLKEIHHRIKNNMSSVENLLTLQEEETKSLEASSILKDAISRVNSMRILYDKMLDSENYEEISLKHYLESLIDSILALFPSRQQIKLHTKIEDMLISSRRAFPLGIMVNELFTNIMKHAFIDISEGEIGISLSKDDETIRLTIQDNGIGFPEGNDSHKRQGFGLMLVSMLAEQLKGNFHIENYHGTRSTISFPEESMD